MIRIKTFAGEIIQTIHVTEDDITYNDLLKYIKIPPHPKFRMYDENISKIGITVKPYIRFFHINVEVNLNDIINFDSELTVGFYFEYYHFNRNTYITQKIGDDFNLPDTSTCDKCKTLIENCPFNIIFIDNEILKSEMMTEEIYKNVVRESGSLLQLIPYEKQTEEICKLAVQQQNGWPLKYVKDQTEEICKLAVQQNGHVLQYVEKQTEEICKLAVRETGYSLQFVKEQTEEICKLAVQQNGYSLQYVEEQTEEICTLAVWQYGSALQWVKNKTEEICKLAVQQNGYALQWVKNQTEEICKLAVRQNGSALQWVKDPVIKHKLSNP